MGQVVKIESKELLESSAYKFGDYVTTLSSEIDSLKTTLSSVENYEDINLTGAGDIIIRNLDNIVADMEIISRNIKSYATGVEENDIFDLDIDGELDDDKIGGGKPKAPPYGSPGAGPKGDVPSSPEKDDAKEDDKNENPDGGSSEVQTPVVNQNTSSNQVSSGTHIDNLDNNVGKDSIVEEPIVENVVEDIPLVDNTVLVGNVSSGNNETMTNTSVSNDKGSSLGVILGAGAAVAAVGVGAVGGAKVIKKMKENQEIDDDDDEE